MKSRIRRCSLRNINAPRWCYLGTLFAGHSLSLYAFFIFNIFSLYRQNQQTKKNNKAEFVSHVWTIQSNLELSRRAATAILKVWSNFDCICTSQRVHVQNCARILGTASALASLQWPHSKVWIARSITPQSEQRAHKHCHTHAGVQAARRADCDKWRAVGGRTVFQGGLNSKTVWATGSLLTWKGAQKTKRSKIYRRHHAATPACPHPPFCFLVGLRRTNWPTTWSEEQQALKKTGSFACALAGIIEPGRQSNHSPPLLESREDQASRLGQGHPAGQTKHRYLVESWLGLNLLTSLFVAGYPLPLVQEYQVCHLFHQYLVDPEKRAS